jgi:hypothetical protein
LFSKVMYGFTHSVEEEDEDEEDEEDEDPAA